MVHGTTIVQEQCCLVENDDDDHHHHCAQYNHRLASVWVLVSLKLPQMLTAHPIALTILHCTILQTVHTCGLVIGIGVEKKIGITGAIRGRSCA